MKHNSVHPSLLVFKDMGVHTFTPTFTSHFQFPMNQINIGDSIGEGLLGMRVGGTRKLLVPPKMAYGQRAIDDMIPADASMQFIIELVRLEE